MAKFGIGQAVRRVEDQRFLLGRGRYVDDINLPGQCHGVTVLSPHAHARIKRVDVSRAKAAPGVLCVLTGADAARIAKSPFNNANSSGPHVADTKDRSPDEGGPPSRRPDTDERLH
jgi:CO/xanthine dehydrogenase Mo-binding subunit